MLRILNLLRKDAADAIRRPKMLLGLAKKDVRRRCYYMVKARLLQARLPSKWQSVDDENENAFQRREYASYDQYLEHQRLKREYLNLDDYDATFRQALGERLSKMEIVSRGKNVLCLAARVGSEVKAFADTGCFAVGIDLNPGQENRYVLQGDFHNLQFPDDSIDLVYTNSLDHAFDIARIIREVRRVLKPDGYLIVEALLGSEEGYSPQLFESFWWRGVDDLKGLFEAADMEVVDEAAFERPWKGVQLSLRSMARVSVPRSARHS